MAQRITGIAEASPAKARAPDASYIYPTNIASLGEDWLIESLESFNPGLRVLSASQSDLIWGTATKVFFDFEYQAGDSSAPIRDRICIKGAFDEKMRNYYDLSVLYTTEAAFYRDVAPTLDILLPKCWLAIEHDNEGIVALEDLGSRGAVFTEASDTWTADQATQILDALARLHVSGWGWSAGTLPWVTLGSGAQRGGNTAMMAGDRFHDLTSRPEVQPHLPAELSDRDTVLAALQRLWREDDQDDELTLCHGDAHLGQTYAMPDGKLGLLDWQSLAVMPWAKDVAYFIGGALATPDRRAHERDLLEYYLRELKACGGPDLDRAKAWRHYRRQMLIGMVWPVVTENMQPLACIATMSQRYLTAMGDLKTLEALES